MKGSVCFTPLTRQDIGYIHASPTALKSYPPSFYLPGSFNFISPKPLQGEKKVTCVVINESDCFLCDK